MRNAPFETMEEVEEYVSGDTIQCLECGRHFKMITGKHLQQMHDITQDEYREKWGIPRTLGLAIAALKEVKRDQALKMHADGVLTVDHLPSASDPRTRRPTNQRAKASRKAQSELAKRVRPGDHSKLPPGSKRLSGRSADRAREYQQAYRALNDGDPQPMIEYRKQYGDTRGWHRLVDPASTPGSVSDLQRVSIYLDEKSLALASELGGGNVSLGMRRALDMAHEALAVESEE